MGDEEEGVTQVLAHGMLTRISVAHAALKLLVRNDLSPEDRRRFGDAAVVQLELVTDILRDLARGLPPEALLLLRRASTAPRPADGAAQHLDDALVEVADRPGS